MHLMVSSAAHQPSKSGSLQSQQLSASSFSYESERLINNGAEILVLYVGRRKVVNVYVPMLVLPSPIYYISMKQRKAKIPRQHLSVAQNSGERS